MLAGPASDQGCEIIYIIEWRACTLFVEERAPGAFPLKSKPIICGRLNNGVLTPCVQDSITKGPDRRRKRCIQVSRWSIRHVR
jgi:hypothetical protein